MTDKEQMDVALQRDIRQARAELVADIGRLRTVVREQVSPSHLLGAHPRFTQGLSIALATFGVVTLAWVWRATKRQG